jgi:hypothetical protein
MIFSDLPRWEQAVILRRLRPDPPAPKVFEPLPPPIPLWMTPDHPDFGKLRRWEQAIVRRRFLERVQYGHADDSNGS